MPEDIQGSKWQSLNLNLGILAPESTFSATMLYCLKNIGFPIHIYRKKITYFYFLKGQMFPSMLYLHSLETVAR